MRTQQNVYLDGKWAKPFEDMPSAELVLLFGNRNYAKDSRIMSEIKAHFPAAQIVGCTTAGEVVGTKVYDDSLCLTAINLEHSTLAVVSSNITNSSTQEVAEKLAKQLEHEGLRYAIVLSDGHQINGTELVNGLQEHLPDNVLISGGLAGDGTEFSETIVWHNDNFETGNILVIGFYGEKLSFGHGCIGGWNAFGPDRTITKSQSNILYELDGKPALELYKKYLLITRTILNINEADGSMIFAGDVPEGATVQLMRANAGNLIDGAELAAVEALDNLKSTSKAGLALLISCVGRRLVLDKYTEEELEVVRDIIGEDWAYAGFYSYGELSPMVNSNICALHNQTMTITTLCETNE